MRRGARRNRGVLRDEGEPLGEPFEPGQVVAGFAQGFVQHVGDRRRAVERQLLVQEAQVGRARDGPGIGFVHSGEQPQQRRLADAVLPDQPDAVAGEAVRETPSRIRSAPRVRTTSWASRAGRAMVVHLM